MFCYVARHSEPQAKNPCEARCANDAESFYCAFARHRKPQAYQATMPLFSNESSLTISSGYFQTAAS
jgi:hypothetical protein